jgi:broad specificity phosphatase PhoE
MNRMRVFLARHGETGWNVEHRLQGRSDTLLTPRGEGHARALAALLRDEPLDAVFTSTLRRTIDTARPIAAERGLRLESRAELVEIGYGVLEGRTAADPDPEIRRLWEERRRDPLRFRAPGGESYAELEARVAPFVEELRRRHAAGSVLIVGHRATNRVLLGLLMGLPLEASLRFKHKHETVLEIRAGEDPACVERRHAPSPTARSAEAGGR